MTHDEEDRACAWNDYRNAYGLSSDEGLAALQQAFYAGWDAAHGTDHAGSLR